MNINLDHGALPALSDCVFVLSELQTYQVWTVPLTCFHSEAGTHDGPSSTAFWNTRYISVLIRIAVTSAADEHRRICRRATVTSEALTITAWHLLWLKKWWSLSLFLPELLNVKCTKMVLFSHEICVVFLFSWRINQLPSCSTLAIHWAPGC